MRLCRPGAVTRSVCATRRGLVYSRVDGRSRCCSLSPPPAPWPATRSRSTGSRARRKRVNLDEVRKHLLRAEDVTEVHDPHGSTLISGILVVTADAVCHLGADPARMLGEACACSTDDFDMETVPTAVRMLGSEGGVHRSVGARVGWRPSRIATTRLAAGWAALRVNGLSARPAFGALACSGDRTERRGEPRRRA